MYTEIIKNLRSVQSRSKSGLLNEAADALEALQKEINQQEQQTDMEVSLSEQLRQMRIERSMLSKKLREKESVLSLLRQGGQQWISVEDRLPDIGSIVLIRQLYSWENNEDGAEITIGRLRPTPKGEKPYWEFQYYRPDFRKGSIMDNDIICPGSEYITHWMPLPEPPEEANNDL